MEFAVIMDQIQCKWGSGDRECTYTTPFLMKKVKTTVNVYIIVYFNESLVL